MAERQRVLVKSAVGFELLWQKDIVLIRAERSCCRICCVDGKGEVREYIYSLPLKTFLENASSKWLVRIHYSHAVNWRKITRRTTQTGRWWLHIEGYPDPLPVSRSYRPVVKKIMEQGLTRYNAVK